MGFVRRVLLSPPWLALHALLVVVLVSFARLGWWQWGAAAGGFGGLRHLAYALQWWVFAGFAVFLWWRMVRAEMAPPTVGERDEPGALGPDAAPTEAEGTVHGGGANGTDLDDWASPALRAARRAAGPGPGPGADPDLVTYNRYLARLPRSDA